MIPSIALIYSATASMDQFPSSLAQMKRERKTTHSVRDVGEIDEATLLLFERVDEFNVTVLSEIRSQFLVGVHFVVFDVSNVNVSRSSRLNDHCDTGRSRTRRFTLST